MPKDQLYVIQRGDSLESLAELIYGDRSSWEQLLNYNNGPQVSVKRGGKLRDARAAVLGEVLYIPASLPAAARALSVVASSAPSSAAAATAVRKAANAAIASQVQKATHALANPLAALASRSASLEPAILTPQMIRASAVFPAEFYIFLESTLKIEPGVVRKLLKSGGEARQLARPYSDPAEGLSAFYGAYRAYKAGKYKDAFNGLVTGTSASWPFLPEQVRQSLNDVMARLISQVPALTRVGDILKDLGDADASGSLLKMVSGLIEGHKERADQGSDEVIKHLKDNPAVAAKVGVDLLLFLTDLLPDAVKGELALKSVGRKIPIIGTIGIGLWDLGDALFHPTDWKKWASVGSSAAGIVPGLGTAASTVIDIVVVVGTVLENIHALVKMEFSGSLLAA